MEALSELAGRAATLGVPPSLVIKSVLGRELLTDLGYVGGLVLQGGGALHHVYGSPRFSADLDFVQTADFEPDAYASGLEATRRRVEAAWGACAVGDHVHRGKLHRQKLRIETPRGISMVLALERYEGNVHRPERRSLSGGPPGAEPITVEAISEIIADKLVAGIDRLRTRGSVKLRDVYDLALMLERASPEPALVEQKLDDYGLPLDLTPLRELARTLDAFAAAELREQLRGVLPASELCGLDAAALTARVRSSLEGLAP